jgi:hypothetical protein
MFRERFWKISLAAALLLSFFVRVSRAEETIKPLRAEKPAPTAAPRFIRVSRDANGSLKSLDTAIATYKLKRPDKPEVVVDLIGAVHIGEKQYYDKLDELFKEYDVLLYELVAPRGTKIPASGKRKGGSPISALQSFMKDLLQLEFQLEQIDYQADNFVHADMSPSEFWASMKERNESPLKMFLSMMRASLAQQAERPSKVNDAVLLAAIFDRKNGPKVLKRALADELGNNDVMLEALNGPNGSTILTERNKVALHVMEEQIEAGKRKIGIFYGAAHLEDMHGRMVGEHDMSFEKIRWLPAWNLEIDETRQKK